jgi:hypothetical protein
MATIDPKKYMPKGFGGDESTAPAAPVKKTRSKSNTGGILVRSSTGRMFYNGQPVSKSFSPGKTSKPATGSSAASSRPKGWIDPAAFMPKGFGQATPVPTTTSATSGRGYGGKRKDDDDDDDKRKKGGSSRWIDPKMSMPKGFKKGGMVNAKHAQLKGWGKARKG